MRRRVIGNMMGQVGSLPDFSNFNHVWDFTNVSGSSVPDIVNSVDLTLSGGYSSDSTGTWATSVSGHASVDTSSLTIPAAFTVMVAIADVNSLGVSNSFGRYISSSTDLTHMNIYQRSSLTNLAYGTGASSYEEITIGDMSTGTTVIAMDTDGLVRVRIAADTVVEATGASNGLSTNLSFMNRSASDRAADAIFVAGGVYDGVQTEAVFLQAAADLLAL